MPTTGRFVSYELEQRGEAVKPDPNDMRPNKRRSFGWPPGAQDVTDALTWLRDEGIVPWDWIADEERRLKVWAYGATVTDYLLNALDRATMDRRKPRRRGAAGARSLAAGCSHPP
jgi:hypothetical protein